MYPVAGSPLRPLSFSQGVFTLFTLFTLFFNRAKRRFECKNWLNKCKSYFVKVLGLVLRL